MKQLQATEYWILTEKIPKFQVTVRDASYKPKRTYTERMKKYGSDAWLESSRVGREPGVTSTYR